MICLVHTIRSVKCHFVDVWIYVRVVQVHVKNYATFQDEEY